MNQGDYPTLGRPDDPIRVVGNAFSSIAPAFLSGIWFTTTGWASDHLATAKGVGNVLNAAARWGNANPDKVVPFLVKYLKADPALAAAEHRPHFVERLVPGQVQPWIDVTAKYAKFASFPATDLIYVPK